MSTPVSDDTFDAEVLKSSVPVLVDFWAPWCGPCKMMLPIVDEIAGEYAGRVKVVKVNVDENAETPGKFGILSIPTFIIFRGGKPVANFVGSKSKSDLEKALDAVLQ